jgi:hypothetical protein
MERGVHKNAYRSLICNHDVICHLGVHQKGYKNIPSHSHRGALKVTKKNEEELFVL